MEKRVSFTEKTKSGTRKTKTTLIYFDSRQRYINPKMTAELSLRSKLSQKFKITTNSKHKYLLVPNVLNREFSVR
jgi:hypothetical protein